MIGGGNVEVDAENMPIFAVQTVEDALRSPKIFHAGPPDVCGAQPYSATSPSAANGNVPVNGEQSVPSCSSTSHAQFAGAGGTELSIKGSGFVSDRTKLEVAADSAGFAPHSNVLVLPSIWKQGSWIPFPTAQRQASGRYGAAIEFVQQDPENIGVELAGANATYGMISVGVGPFAG